VAQPRSSAKFPPDALPIRLPLPADPGQRLQLGGVGGAALGLVIARLVESSPGLVVAVARDSAQAAHIEAELRFFLGERADAAILSFPDWEILPYDLFAPLPELVSQRLLTLHRLGRQPRGVLIVPVGTLLQRIAPPSFLDSYSLLMQVGERLDLEDFRARLTRAGYQCVSQVMGHGEFAPRGSLLDLFPMGSAQPYRIDLFDDEIDSIRLFDPETQRSADKVERIELLPAREFPLDDVGIATFRRRFRARFEGDPTRVPVYRDLSSGSVPGGSESYLPLFFDDTATLLDYLPADALLCYPRDIGGEAEQFFAEVASRYDQRRHDIERPLLAPAELYLWPDELAGALKQWRGIALEPAIAAERAKGFAELVNLPTRGFPDLTGKERAAHPFSSLEQFLRDTSDRVLLLADTPGRREHLLETLASHGLRPKPVEGWAGFLADEARFAITHAPLDDGFWLSDPGIALIPERLLLGERVRQARRRRKGGIDPELVVRNLAELQIGAPVVHEQHGVGRYLGLTHLDVGGMRQEFLAIQYAGADKLYVPVASLHLIGRYTGATEEAAPLHKLGGDQWEKLKRKAAEKVRDVAAELLEIYARRAAREGRSVPAPGSEYQQFADQFPFEETPDQQSAIDAVIADMTAPQPMDRVVCGDVGFGKTEVAMRAAFLAVQGGRQVAMLVPTTLLAQQHWQNFSDRFADWPVRVELLSRFRSAKEEKTALKGLEEGKVDILIGTHKLLGQEVRFKDLGLVIIDEEHRFGVRHKERLKALRAEVDILTLTATPIPRTLNLAMSGLRDLSIIATPPISRHPIKTFVSEWNDALIAEACQREIKRGGQVYFLHNRVETIDKVAAGLQKLVPAARVQVAHGQMRERDLEQIMRDFYHQRFNILVCTTIVESGIDVPSANTIIIDRADKLGLAQLHQLRGRVGRSHHLAYAYLLAPPPKVMTADALKRLDAIQSLEDLGAGFSLATHDLEIRGAGELLGEEQSGQIHEVGFSLYTRMLERAVEALKAGRSPELDRPLDHGTEVDLGIPALLPEDYLPDVHARLILYKRIASAADQDELDALSVEMIDRFGLLPDPAKNLMGITALKLRLTPLGVKKLEAGPKGGRLIFGPEPKVDPARVIKLIQTRPLEFKLDGADKLRFFREMEAAEQRLSEVRRILDQVFPT